MSRSFVTQRQQRSSILVPTASPRDSLLAVCRTMERRARVAMYVEAIWREQKEEANQFTSSAEEMESKLTCIRSFSRAAESEIPDPECPILI